MTVKQQQCLLNYLGYDTGGIDGITGRKTEAALADIKRRYGCGPEGLIGIIAGTVPELDVPDINVGSKTGTFWDTVKWFSRSEFGCQGHDCDGFPYEPAEKLVRILDALRDFFGVPGEISSAVRCAQHNAEVGGVYNSRHLKGWAADVNFRGIAPARVIEKAYEMGCNYAYSIQSNGRDSGYVHIDIVL